MVSRQPAVAGKYYPASPSQLTQSLDLFFQDVDRRTDALGVVAPHAGYPFSGQVAAYSYASVSPDFDGTFLIFGPSHAGSETCTSVIPWKTPLGTTEIDVDLAESLDIPVDETAHRYEHSIEVQLPFIQYLFPESRIVPVMIGDQSLPSVMKIADLVDSALVARDNKVRFVASSDFSHYVPDTWARHYDLLAISALEDLNISEFYQIIMEHNITACGFGPIGIMAELCRRQGAEHASLLKYITSGDITGDLSAVVGYAAIAVI